MSWLREARAGWIGVLGRPELWAQAPAALYVEELFAQAGLLNWRWLAGCDELLDPSVAVAVIPNGRLVAPEDVAFIRRFVESGGGLLVLGRPGALSELFSVRAQPPVREGWLVRGERADGRFAHACPVPLHVFDVVHLLAADSTATIDSPIHFSVGNHQVNWPVSARVSIGKGHALLLAADIPGSVVRIQQGLAVHHDGQPAPDGSADLADGILKCEDAIVLDWTRDRQQPVAELCPIFLQPQVDLLRELLVGAVVELAERVGLLVAVLSPWPRGLPAVGLVSHESDLNEPDKVHPELAADARADILATWCVLSGTDDGAVSEYSPEILARIAASGHEIALHYDAHTAHPACRWGQETLREQLGRLRRRMRAVGIDAAVYSSKNHYTRWEGRLEFFRWLLAAGIRVDQSKGPTKRGDLGCPFGTCHPWRPIDDEVSPPYLMNLLEIGFTSQDLGGTTCPAQFGCHYIDTATARGGVAHVVFHPWQADRAELRENLVELVAYGRSRGLEWWTSRQIGAWQFARRAVRLNDFSLVGTQAVLGLAVGRDLEGAILGLAGAGAGTSGPTGFAEGNVACRIGLSI